MNEIIERARQAIVQIEVPAGGTKDALWKLLEHCMMLETRIGALENTKALLCQAAIALRSVPDKAVFGIGGEGITHWYIVDELLSRIDAALAAKPK